MLIGITMLQHTIYKQSSPVWVDNMDPVWVDNMDPVWIITVALFGSYNTVQFINHCLV